MNIGSFDLSGAAAPECTLKISSSTRWLVGLFLPLAPLFFLGLIIAWLSIAEAPCCFTARVFRCCSGDVFYCRKVTRCMDRAVSWLQAKALGCVLPARHQATRNVLPDC